MKCPFCSEEVADEAIKCKHCGSIIDKEKFTQLNHQRSGTTGSPEAATEELSDFYKKAFAKIDANNGKFTLIFNWASFGFGGFWYLAKGLWVKGIAMLALIFLLAALPIIFIWGYTAVAGTYDLYLLKVKRKQLW